VSRFFRQNLSVNFEYKKILYLFKWEFYIQKQPFGWKISHNKHALTIYIKRKMKVIHVWWFILKGLLQKEFVPGVCGPRPWSAGRKTEKPGSTAKHPYTSYPG
jgi:hypothetical protein